MVTRRGLVSSTAATGLALAIAPSVSAQPASAAAEEQPPGNLLITIRPTEEEGIYAYDVETAELDLYVSWHNATDVDHQLEITQDGAVTTRATLNPNDILDIKFHGPGRVHYECTTHGESGEI